MAHPRRSQVKAHVTRPRKLCTGCPEAQFKGRIEWALIQELIDVAYRRVALKRMLKALDGGGA